MKKIGIITLYHNNMNYGGLLQAYALCKYLNNKGIDTKQISTNFISNNDRKLLAGGCGLKGKAKRAFKKCIYAVIKKKIKNRQKTMSKFEKDIPHTSVVYNHDNIRNCSDDFDIFITGSDQVWNFRWYKEEYFLSFVEKGKKKYSYAASMPNINLSKEQKDIFIKHTKDFEGISVREALAVEYASNLSQKNVVQVLDPTLLLSSEEWTDIIKPIDISGDYIFCYFLTNTSEIKKEIKQFAKEKKLKIVTLPHIGTINVTDCFFGNKKLYNVSPNQFLYLIKEAKFVFTDSFHATVFSNLFKTNYFVFTRKDGNEMNSRIVSLLEMFGENDRLFLSGIDINKINKLTENEVNNPQKKFYEMQEQSEKYLDKIITN